MPKPLPKKANTKKTDDNKPSIWRRLSPFRWFFRHWFKLFMVFALLIAVPLSWMMMDNWLSNFAYHIEVEWWMFAIAGLAAMSIAFLTVSFQSIKAAMVNPIESLRNE